MLVQSLATKNGEPRRQSVELLRSNSYLLLVPRVPVFATRTRVRDVCQRNSMLNGKSSRLNSILRLTKIFVPFPRAEPMQYQDEWTGQQTPSESGNPDLCQIDVASAHFDSCEFDRRKTPAAGCSSAKNGSESVKKSRIFPRSAKRVSHRCRAASERAAARACRIRSGNPTP
jgi:hypothetical protein